MKLEIYHLYSLMLSRVFHWKKTQESTLEMAHSRTFSRRVCPNVAGSISSLLSCAAIMLLLYRQPVGAQDTSPAPVSIPDVKLLSVQFVIDKHAVSVFISNLKYRVWCIKNIMSEKVLWFYFSSFSLFYLYYYNYHLSYSPLFPFPSTTVSFSPTSTTICPSPFFHFTFCYDFIIKWSLSIWIVLFVLSHGKAYLETEFWMIKLNNNVSKCWRFAKSVRLNNY